MLYYAYFNVGGVPRLGLMPVWQSLRTAGLGIDKSAQAPAITEVGGGWYRFEVRYGIAPWDVAAEDLVGVIDGGAALPNEQRYKPVCVTLRGLGLARIAHRGVQDKVSGNVEIFATDGVTPELLLEMKDENGVIERSPIRVGA